MKYIPNIIRILFLGIFIFLLAKGKVMLWLALFGFSLIAAFFFGKVYCGYGCPINTLIIPVNWISKKLNLQSSKTPKWLKSGYFAWITLIISIIAIVISKRFFNANLPILPFWIIIAILITLKYKPAVFHNLICPFGALQRSCGRFAKFSTRINTDTCVGCQLCEEACTSNAIAFSTEDNKAKIDPALCHQCLNCRHICPPKAVYYGKE